MALEQAPGVPGFSVPGPDFRTQSDEEFNERCQVWVDEQPPFHAGVVDMGAWIKRAADYVDNVAAGVDLSAQDAADFAGIAAGAAHFKGRWPTLSGELLMPASAEYQDKLWQLLEDVADVAAHEPGVSSVWLDLSAQGGLQLVAGATDLRDFRALNRSWARARGMSGSNDLRLIALNSPADVAGIGVVQGMHDASILGVPDSAAGQLGALTIFGVAEIADAQSVALMFIVQGKIWVRPATSSAAWGEWVQAGTGSGGGGGGSVEDGPIKTLVQNFSSANQVSNNIAITIDCSEHTSFVVNAQNAPFPNASGAYNITISNLPEPGEGLFIGRIRARNLGRKAVNFILPAGLTASWLTTPQFSTANTAGATGWDWIEFFRSPDQPGILYLDQVNGR